jgi:hypothetical protein
MMSFAPSSPVTGAAVTGLTSPTYTLTADTNPAVNAKQYYVSALGGTQTGVTTHSVGSPFIVSMWRPVTLLLASFFSTLTGFRSKNPVNRYKQITIKGVTPVVGSPIEPVIIRIDMEIPAGSETNDLINVKAAISAAFGLAYATASGVADTVSTGTL